MARYLRFRSRRQVNPVAAQDYEQVQYATYEFWRHLEQVLGNENWRMSVRDEPPDYTVVINIEDCPGRGDFDRCEGEVLDAFEESGLGDHLYYDGTDYGPMPGPNATAEDIEEMGCPERGYHFYDPKSEKGLEAGLGGWDTPEHEEAQVWERSAIQAAANPSVRKLKAKLLR